MTVKKKNIKIGVVGIGHLGNYHLQKYQKLDNCELIGVSDAIYERAKRAAETYGCQAFTDYRNLLDKVDAVSIAVPTGEHFQVAGDFLAAGIDVLIEKPICATVKEADELIELAGKNKLILQVGFVERFNPAVMALDKVITRPLFIEVHRLHPFFERGTDVDVVLDLMIHDLDIILKFVDSKIKSLEAVGVPVLSDKVDISNVRLSFACGCIANVTASRISAKTMQKIRFFSPEGYHAVDYQKREIISLNKQANAEGKQQIVQNNIEVGSHDPLEEEIRSFVEAVVNRTAPLVSGEDARKSLALAVEIIRKMKTSEVLRK
ncbi:MAG TPA: Gfo/Idh/MocA family oxidoreductase [Smithellaceae bacterium]|jgi:predicted dehydrogenase|nr:Gfo/Idh/MocA family oxidoreductase [Syntrophaceae bacterium]HNQ17599.1 Gfo/Idh/MocA family oxidoreductase [Smithellaceae bacterium]MBP8609595.1 Gfo/Idh/MocA family oxidoreductase [Syntrophaceae bacterium]HNT90097.1 Gfo/Idh/MocA family oxidoreductase [Smithellaceae bacterium]HNV65162.1 Gfo/Idh/MocA family oxidoreductase [Smithellaceae bacterium]